MICLKMLRGYFLIFVIFTYCSVNVTATFKRNPAFPSNSTCGFQELDIECKGCKTQAPGKITFFITVFGGREAYINEYPWMALLGYTNSKGTKKWGCGGSIINSKYVLTAAHCVARVPKFYGKLTSVVLGEHNTKDEVDCARAKFGGEICNIKPTSAEIEEIIVHPTYNKEEEYTPNDIALLRLKEELQFSTFIQPICLPEPEHELEDGMGELWTAGWGLMENYQRSSSKRTVDLDFMANKECVDAFSSAGLKLINTQICAGGEPGKDTCAGDSGGPLMIKEKSEPRWFQVGVVSFGGVECGKYPGIYTKVSNFVEWLHATVKP